MTTPDPAAVLASLSRIWSRVLHVENVDENDDFFDLGGTSLEAVAMLALVEAELSAKIDLATFFETRNLRELARTIGASPVRPGGNPIVPLRPGSGPPLVLVHPHGGSALSYLDLVDGLAADRAVHGVMARGIESGEPAPPSLLGMADDYVAALEQDGPDGPMLLGGWSFGAFAAFECAVRLREHGGDPLALILLDPRPPTRGGDTVPLHRQIADTWHIETDLDALDAMPEADRFQRLLDAGIDQGRVPPDMTAVMLARRARVRDANTRAFLAYTAERTYPGATHVFTVTGEGPHPCRVINAYWRERLTGTVTYHDVPGTHGRLLKPPAVAALAASLGDLLDRIAPIGDSHA